MMFFVFLAVILGANYYVFYRLYHLLPAGIFMRSMVVLVGVLTVLSFFAGILLAGKISTPLASFFYSIGTSWFFIMVYLVIVFLLFDIARMTKLFPMEKVMYENWKVFVGLVALVGTVCSLGYAHYRDKKRIEINIEAVEGKELKNPLKIVALSDLHLGYGVGKNEFSKWVELINLENPDVVLLAGDIVDNTVRPLLEQDFASVFQKIKSTYGVYAALGNHEYIGGLPDVLSFLEKSGVTVLRDSVVLLNRSVYLAGRDDKMNPSRKSVAELTEGIDPSKRLILLDHQPYHLEELEKSKVTLQFSGHTHRGQIWPFSWITDKMYEVSHGYLKKGNTHLYVSSGMGLWGGKFRIGTQSEYVVINLY